MLTFYVDSSRWIGDAGVTNPLGASSHGRARLPQRSSEDVEVDSRLPAGFRRWRRQFSVAGVADTSAQAGVLDAPSTAKLYLDSVSRRRMYPPSTSQSASLGTITFLGSSAHAGVGGMECARDILERHDFEGRSSKAEAAGGSRNAAAGSGNTAGILDPVSIHPVPASQSRLLTLVAVMGGGLRYYLSFLTSSSINLGQDAWPRVRLRRARRRRSRPRAGKDVARR